ncbi:hypothetical protein CHLNCDRAFT_145232 [Chlorella variabilis]|uniref:NodB homology domain-containing protein n=1 Tax=Chlorella variabilis TaxID=554065 RepID=E1ZDZ5_CHLVA|nr:hypothetical protein CHLNCDRAFT_145232 [Chlorella variabilis]EFN55781.1 hypothetical protein CHLNCDRAFT_145232 [Chlorella variabilis]|eukprot:XP_005847883.1 hypothetical protein CHLNCDRAFT_145232 [Chlorella variabilis]
MRSLGVALLLAAAALCAAAGVPPSINAPGNLTRDQLPMFVLFTHDDGVDSEARKAMLGIAKGRETPNGCPVTATMFTLLDPDGWTSCEEVVAMYEAGFEVADHTTLHESLPGKDREYLQDEIAGARSKIAECGVPEEDIVGFRSPYLNTGPLVREVLSDNGFLCDSSVIEDWNADLVQDGTEQNCTGTEKWPGLYEVPVWRYENTTGFLCDLPYAMDPGFNYDCNCMNDTHSTYDIIKSQFDAAYNGNRAPFPVFIHIYWLQAQDNTKELERFIDYTLTLPDVHYVTIRQLLAWMQNPVPKDQLTPEMLGCGNPGGAPSNLAEERRRLRRA